MPLIDMKDMLRHAYENGYAVGAFDLTEMDFLPAVLTAAESARAPVILNMIEPWFESPTFAWFMAAVEAAAARASVPVAVCFDRGTDAKSAMRGVRLGADGVVASALRESLLRHIDRTRATVDAAHACGVPVEGELAYVADGDALEGGAFCAVQPTTVAEARSFVERTNVDFLAVPAKMARGPGKSRLDWRRLKEINAALRIPLVVRDGFDLGDEQCRRLIMQGVAKIHCSAALDDMAGERLRANVRRDRNAPYGALKEGVNEVIAARLEPRMRAWGSAGRAAEVLGRCGLWNNIMHVVVFNAPRLDTQALRALMAEGQRALSGIAGVRIVQVGSVVDADGRYRHCILARLVSAAAAEALCRHPAYIAYMERRLAPVASDRIAGDYRVADHIPGMAPLPLLALAPGVAPAEGRGSAIC